MHKVVVTGIDIGGSHITGGIIEMATRTVLNNLVVRKKVDSKGDAATILNGWCSAIKELWEKTGSGKMPLGFAMPGPFDYENGICLIDGLDKYEALYGMNIRQELSKRLGMPEEDICFRNDAEAFLEGELFCGAATGYQHAIGITLGTGLGSAYSHNGITCDAELSILPYKGEIIEQYVSTRGLVRNYEKLTGKKLKDVQAVSELFGTDKAARIAFSLFANDLAWFLKLFIQKENPEVLVIGGNIMQAWECFMPEALQQLAFSELPLPLITKAMLGEHALLIGGACCFYKPEAEMMEQTTLKNYATVAKRK